MELIKASLMAAVGGGGANVAPKPDTVVRNGTYYARDDNLDGYTQFDVNVPIKSEITGSFSENGEYYPPSGSVWNHIFVNVDYKPKEDATLKEVTAVEDVDQVVEPADGSNDYYPYVYLGAVEWPPEGQDYEDVGKRFDGLAVEYTVTPFIDIIDKSTGLSVTGYPKRIAPTASWSITQGGYMRIDGWEMASDTSIKVYMTRYNTNYTQPISWNQSTSTTNYLAEYTTGPYVIKTKQTS